MRKGRDGEKKMEKMENGMENNDENSGSLTSLPVDRLTATDCNAAARAKSKQTNTWLCVLVHSFVQSRRPRIVTRLAKVLTRMVRIVTRVVSIVTWMVRIVGIVTVRVRIITRMVRIVASMVRIVSRMARRVGYSRGVRLPRNLQAYMKCRQKLMRFWRK